MSNLGHWLDPIPLWLVFTGGLVLMILAVEAGHILGTHWPGRQSKQQPSQVRSLMGAGLGLVAFMLAIGFSIAQSHFEARSQAFLEEVSATAAAYMSAGLLTPEEEDSARDLLRQFVNSRVQLIEGRDTLDNAAVWRLIETGESIEERLWQLAQTEEVPAGDTTGQRMFAEAVLRMIDANEQRKQAALYNRISPVIWLTLMLIAVLGMLVTGYQAGLSEARSRIATWALALTFAMVMALVIDLDRPRMTLFKVNQQQMVDLQHYIEAYTRTLGGEASGGG
jgi:hypothetical protein